MIPADGPLFARVVVGAKPERNHPRVGHRTCTRQVLALVHNVFIRDQFAGVRCGRLKLAGGRWGCRCLVVAALIALARRYGLDNQHWREREIGMSSVGI